MEEMWCSFKQLLGDCCGQDRKDVRVKDNRTVPLLACNKDIRAHKRTFSFSGPESEVDLILYRAGVFSCPADIETWTVCPYHRSKLGLGWSRGSNTRCQVPASISNHGNSKTKYPKYERGLGKVESQLVLSKSGILVQIGSGRCL